MVVLFSPLWSKLIKIFFSSFSAPGKDKLPSIYSAFTLNPHSPLFPKWRPISINSPLLPLPENVCVYLVIGSSVARFVIMLIVPGAGVAPLSVPLFDILTPFTPALGPEVISILSITCVGGVVN